MTTPDCNRDSMAALPPAHGSQFHDAMAMRSLKLQELLRSHHYRKGDGVSTAGQTLVSRLAKERGLRDWAHTRTIGDYDALITAVTDHFANT